jgi:hypothetical protein
MKKQSILLVISILTAIIFISCTQKTIKTEEKDFTQKYYLSTDTAEGALSVDIHVEIPVAFAQKNVFDSIRTTIISTVFGEQFVSHATDSIVQLFAATLHEEYKANNEPLINELDSTSSYSFNNEHTVEGFSLLSDKNIYSYGIDRYVYMGGAHGLSNRIYFNFDLKTGRKILENDLFVKGYEKSLTELIKKRIIEESKENNDTEPIIDLEDTDFWIDSIKPNGNFYITDESINYVFNPYEIAPYYMGQTEVSLPFSRIKKMLKSTSIIAYLVEKQMKQ